MFGALEIPLVCAGPQHINVPACLFSSLAFYAISRKDVSHHLRSIGLLCAHAPMSQTQPSNSTPYITMYCRPHLNT